MVKILIADKSLAFAKQVAGRFSGDYEIRICENGAQVLDVCRLWRPDYMLLDMGLTMVDGLTILRTLHSSLQMVRVLAKTSCVYSGYVMQTLADLGISYVLPDPCTVTAAVSQLNSLMDAQEDTPWDADEWILSLLLHLGFQPGKGGFACTCEGMRVMNGDPTMPVTKVVYPLVAHICGGTPERVERAIRGAIERAWKNRDDRVWQYYFSPGRDGQIRCPTNGEFLSRMALCMNRRKIV